MVRYTELSATGSETSGTDRQSQIVAAINGPITHLFLPKAKKFNDFSRAGAGCCRVRVGSPSEVDVPYTRAESRGSGFGTMHGGARPTVMIQRKEFVASLLLAPWCLYLACRAHACTCFPSFTSQLRVARARVSALADAGQNTRAIKHGAPTPNSHRDRFRNFGR